MLETVQFDIPNELLYQYALQSLTILDPLHIDKERIVGADTPEIHINSFAVLSNTAQLAFNNKKRPKGELPGMVSSKADPAHVRAARMLFNVENLTQDNAFERYKIIMKRLADAAYNAESQKNWEKGVKGKK